MSLLLFILLTAAEVIFQKHDSGHVISAGKLWGCSLSMVDVPRVDLATPPVRREERSWCRRWCHHSKSWVPGRGWGCRRRCESCMPSSWSSLHLFCLDCPFFQNSRGMCTHLASLSSRVILSMKSFLTSPSPPHYLLLSVFFPSPNPGSSGEVEQVFQDLNRVLRQRENSSVTVAF